MTPPSSVQSATTYVYRFGDGTAEGSAEQKELLGGKGANLNEMSAIGLPVPAGYTITTEACRAYIESEGAWPEGLREQVHDGIAHLEAVMDQTFGDPANPLLVSVRSGAAVSMPGMMDTVLNLGLNDRVVEGLAHATDNPRFAYDSYRRFIDMFGDVVMGVPHGRFEQALTSLKKERGVESDLNLTASDLRDLVDRYKAIYRQATGRMFPDDPYEQLEFAVGAVFSSWTNERAVKYRAINGITGLRGTGVNVQTMVYGNKGENCGTGVCFTRNPATGEPSLYGEFLLNAQGEDVVAGIRTPRAITEMKRIMPAIYDELDALTTRLEEHYGNMQDIEFTVEEGDLYILQTRNGKRTGPAALRIATDMVDEGLVETKTAVRTLVDPGHLDQLLHPRFEDTQAYQDDVLGTGLPASPGAAVGRVIFDADTAEVWSEQGQSVILVRIETSPEDVGGMDAAEGILTSRGGMTSHAAVVARGWGKPCVAGCSDIIVNDNRKSFTNGTVTVHEGDWISINGTTGEVMLGQHPLVDPDLSDDFARFMEWADRFRTMNVRTNADTPEDAHQARDFGAEGIGLCRTEHMFFGGERVRHMQEMILADDEFERREALKRLLPYQREDFAAIFEAMDGCPVTVRLLDPPLHEFLPADEREQADVADALGVSAATIREKVDAHREFNPMLGHRGCRLGVTHPEITKMQARALFEAALDMQSNGVAVHPEIMVPLISTTTEFENQKTIIDRTAERVFKAKDASVDYEVGSMIEIPRAALQAGAIAEQADFFSFGTNDLTQMTFGFSRDDVGTFLADYVERGIIDEDPFRVLDPNGVGELIRLATERGCTANPDMHIGICGEHGGEPSSVAFCHRIGMTYVSCSPFRVPIARLAAAQAALADDNG